MLSIYLSIHASIYLSIHPSIYLSIYIYINKIRKKKQLAAQVQRCQPPSVEAVRHIGFHGGFKRKIIELNGDFHGFPV